MMLEEVGSTRAHSAYAVQRSPMADHFRARYLTPTRREITLSAQKTASLRDRLWAIVPMAQHDPAMAETIRQAAAYLSSKIERGRVLFLDGGSCPQNVEAARKEGAVVLRQDRIFDAIDWDRLLPLLHLRCRPFRRAGKGFNVFAGHLALAALGVRDTDLVFQCDADVRGYEILAPLERLVAAWVGEEGLAHVKLAQPGQSTATKEALLQSSVAMYLQSVVMHGKAPHVWSQDDIEHLNRRVMPHLGDIPVIGDTHGPVAIHRIEPDRIIPSVRALSEAGMVDLEAVAKIVIVEGAGW